MSNKEAVRDLLDRLPEDASIYELVREISKLGGAAVAEPEAIEPIETEEGFLMLPVELSNEEISRAIRADRDAQ